MHMLNAHKQPQNHVKVRIDICRNKIDILDRLLLYSKFERCCHGYEYCFCQTIASVVKATKGQYAKVKSDICNYKSAVFRDQMSDFGIKVLL